MVDSSVKSLQPITIQKSFFKCGFFINALMSEFTNILNHYLERYLGENDDDWSDEIKLFDIHSLPRYEHQMDKPFVQLDPTEILLTNTGDIDQGNKLDLEISAIDTVIAESRAWEMERETHIQDTISSVSSEDYEIELNEENSAL
jgi:hypothetical protein